MTKSDRVGDILTLNVAAEVDFIACYAAPWQSGATIIAPAGTRFEITDEDMNVFLCNCHDEEVERMAVMKEMERIDKKGKRADFIKSKFLRIYCFVVRKSLLCEDAC